MLLKLIAGLALLGPGPEDASPAGPPFGSEVDEQAALLVLVEPTAGAELELVLGAHLRTAGLPPRFEPCADAETCEARVAIWAERPRAGALIWLEERSSGWVVHGLGPGRAPRMRELGGLDVEDAAQLETLAQAAASLAASVAAEPAVAADEDPDPTAPVEDEAAPVEGEPPASEPGVDEGEPSQRRWAEAPRRRVFTLASGYSGWGSAQGWQSGVSVQLGWTFAMGLDLGVGVDVVARSSTLTRIDERTTVEVQQRRWPIYASVGYRLPIARRFDLDFGARGGVEWRTASPVNRPVPATPVPVLGALASLGIWAGGPITVRVRVGLEVPLGQSDFDSTPIRALTGLDLQFGVGPAPAG